MPVVMSLILGYLDKHAYSKKEARFASATCAVVNKSPDENHEYKAKHVTK